MCRETPRVSSRKVPLGGFLRALDSAETRSNSRDSLGRENLSGVFACVRSEGKGNNGCTGMGCENARETGSARESEGTASGECGALLRASGLHATGFGRDSLSRGNRATDQAQPCFARGGARGQTREGFRALTGMVKLPRLSMIIGSRKSFPISTVFRSIREQSNVSRVHGIRETGRGLKGVWDQKPEDSGTYLLECRSGVHASRSYIFPSLNLASIAATPMHRGLYPSS